MKHITLIALLLISLCTYAQKEENHFRAYTGAGVGLVNTVTPLMQMGVTYNVSRVYSSANISMLGNHKRAIYEIRSGYIIGRGPYIIPHVAVAYEFKKRTFMLYKDATAPSWSDPDNIVLPQRIRLSWGITTYIPMSWERSSLYVGWSMYQKGYEYYEQYPDGGKHPVRGNGNGNLFVNKWQRVETIPFLLTIGITKRLTKSACDDPSLKFRMQRNWFN